MTRVIMILATAALASTLAIGAANAHGGGGGGHGGFGGGGFGGGHAGFGEAQHTAFPARWLDGVCRALPGAEFLLASLTPAKITDSAPVDATAAFASA